MPVTRTLKIVATAAAASLILAGCGASAGAEDPSSSSAPAPTQPSYALEPSRSQLIAESIGQCLTDLGWEVRVSNDAGVTNVNPLPDAEVAIYQADYNACSEEVAPSDQTFTITDDILERAWQRESESWICLQSAGYTVDEVPSLPVYIETARADAQYSTWTLLVTSNDLAPNEMTRLSQVCPDPLQWFGE